MKTEPHDENRTPQWLELHWVKVLRGEMLSSGTTRHPQCEHPLKNSHRTPYSAGQNKKVWKFAFRKLQWFLSEGQFHRQLFPQLESRQSNCQILSWCKSGNDVCVPKPGALHPERIWPVASKVARAHILICSMSGTDRNVFKPEGPQCWVYVFSLYWPRSSLIW